MSQIDSRPHANDGKRLVVLRRSLGMTQPELSKFLGCTDRTIRNYEKAKSWIPQPACRKVWKAFGVTLVPGDPDEDPYLITKQLRSSPDAEEKVQIWIAPKSKPTLISRFWQFRTWCIFYKKYVLSRNRRATDDALSFIYHVAAGTFCIEIVQRELGGWKHLQNYHDALFLGSFVTLTMLFIPMLLTIPWGIKK